MMATGLNGRVVRLERAMLAPASSAYCSACGLPHVRLSIPSGVVEAIARAALGMTTAAPPRLCLCTACCADGHDISRLTHGLPLRERRNVGEDPWRT